MFKFKERPNYQNSQRVLSKEFMSQFKSMENVEAFLTELHIKVYESMLQREMEAHLGYEKSS